MPTGTIVDLDPKIFLTDDRIVFWPTEYHKTLRVRCLTDMGNTDTRLRTTAQLKMLTPAEREICVLHFVDGRSLVDVAAWVGTSPRMVQMHVRSAVVKVPALAHLRVKSRAKIKSPKMTPFSQFGSRGVNPFFDL